MLMLNEVDFDRIRGDFPNGQGGAFEELVCQLARREVSPPASFRRIEGSGATEALSACTIRTVARLGIKRSSTPAPATLTGPLSISRCVQR